MARWEPGTRKRLQAAALDLYVRQGFEATTVAEIAASVGLTERTYFRHFADKREVLFDGQDELGAAFLDGVAAAPADASPLQAVRAALASAASFFAEERRPWSRRRQQVISANPGLQERELLKLAALAGALAAALRERGTAPAAAALAAQSAVTVFGVAFEQWIAPEEERPFAEVQAAVLAELVGLLGDAHGDAHGDANDPARTGGVARG